MIRYGDTQRFQVRLTEAPNAAEAPREPRAQAEPAKESATRLGLAVAPITAEIAQRYQFQGQTQGLVVTDVESFSAAARYGITEGTRILAVDGQAVADVAAFRRLVERKRPGEVVSLRVIFIRGENGILNVRLPD